MSQEELVQPVYEREPDSVPGLFYVMKDQCILCLLPPATAPKSITWDEQFQRSGCAFVRIIAGLAQPGGEPKELDHVIKAACSSCVGAIRYCGTDAKILARFRDLGY